MRRDPGVAGFVQVAELRPADETRLARGVEPPTRLTIRHEDRRRRATLIADLLPILPITPLPTITAPVGTIRPVAELSTAPATSPLPPASTPTPAALEAVATLPTIAPVLPGTGTAAVAGLATTVSGALVARVRPSRFTGGRWRGLCGGRRSGARGLGCRLAPLGYLRC